MPRALRPEATSTAIPGQALRKPGSGLALISPPVGSITIHDRSEIPSTEEQLSAAVVPTRDLRDLALRLKESVDEIPVVVHAEKPTYHLGDQLSFWVQNPDEDHTFEITADLIYETDVAYVWVEEGQTYDYDAIASAVDRFSEVSYPAVRDFFGSEWKPGVDNDPRLHILHASQIGAGYAGYYSSADEYSKMAFPFSNEKEMFYINLSWLNSLHDVEEYASVLTHEFQHMVHWHTDRNEATWVNEGLSEYAQEVAGFDPDTGFASTFANRPDTQLNTWSEDPAGRTEHYGSAYLFMAYFAQRFGQEKMAEVVAHPADGPAGFDAVLADTEDEDGTTALTFDAVFADWTVANYVDDPNALGMDGVFGYRNLAQREPVLSRVYESYPADMRRGEVPNYATDYILLNGDGDVVVTFNGQTESRLVGTSPYSGDFAWWSNRSDDSDTRLTRLFDLSDVPPDTPVEMDAEMWWSIEQNFDYGYVMASRDGQKWELLEGERTTSENPHGTNFGTGYTSKSHRSAGDAPEDDAVWVTETFDLSPYRGDEVYIRFEYVTDDAVNGSGWLVDDVRIPAIDYFANFEDGPDGWESEGWLLTDGRLQQRWLLQVLQLQDNLLTDLERHTADQNGFAEIEISSLGDGVTAVLAISPLAPVTTEPAEYEYHIERP